MSAKMKQKISRVDFLERTAGEIYAAQHHVLVASVEYRIVREVRWHFPELERIHAKCTI
jgi:hypothetical protein